MTASFPTSVKTFSDAESYLDKIQTLQARMRETQEEITAIETALKANDLFGVTALDSATLSISEGTLSGVTYSSTALRPELTWVAAIDQSTDLYYQKVGLYQCYRSGTSRTSVIPIPGMCGMDDCLAQLHHLIGVIALVTQSNKVINLSGVTAPIGV